MRIVAGFNITSKLLENQNFVSEKPRYSRRVLKRHIKSTKTADAMEVSANPAYEQIEKLNTNELSG
jgi:hypothetical protein